MIDPKRKELLRIIAEISEIAPQIRLGQLLANLSHLSKGDSSLQAVWDAEDDELLGPAAEHLETWKSMRLDPAMSA